MIRILIIILTAGFVVSCSSTKSASSSSSQKSSSKELDESKMDAQGVSEMYAYYIGRESGGHQPPEPYTDWKLHWDQRFSNLKATRPPEFYREVYSNYSMMRTILGAEEYIPKDGS